MSVRIGALDRAPARIKVVGVGTSGCNRVKWMMHRAVPGMSFAMVNTNDYGMETNDLSVDVIQIGTNRARVWGSGGGYRAEFDGPSDESSQQLRQSLSNADLVFVTAGMGGGTGTGVAPYVAHLAKEQGALVVGLVTAPFGFEGRRRMGLAVAGVDRLRPHVDNLILIHNDRLLTYFDRNAHMAQAFETADEVVAQAIMGMSELINVPQEVNLELDDVRSIMKCRGRALMAIGRGSGTAGPAEAVRQAFANPLLDLPFDRATGVLMMFKGGAAGMTLGGVNAARQVVADAVQKDATVFMGVGIDERMGEEISLTLIATGLQHAGPDGPDQTEIIKERHP
ncbi:MAG: cell division FtsZ family protein [Chloroflexi bacterium]|nr:cell division FtsZ family protein [Chloroflexota bacterium]